MLTIKFIIIRMLCENVYRFTFNNNNGYSHENRKTATTDIYNKIVYFCVQSQKEYSKCDAATIEIKAKDRFKALFVEHNNNILAAVFIECNVSKLN